MWLLFVPADVLNTLLEHDLDDPVNNDQHEEEEEVEIDDDDGEEDVPETDGEEEQEEEDKEDEENGIEMSSMSISPFGCSSTHRASTFSTISSLSTISKDSMFSTLSVASESYSPSLFSVASGTDSDFFEDSDDYTCYPPLTEKCSPKSGNKASARLSQHLYRLFIKPKNPRSLSRAKSLGNPESKNLLAVREKRSNSLPQQVKLQSPEPLPHSQSQTLRHVCFRRRPILSSDEDNKNTTLRVVVFGADHVAGKVARAYSSLRRKESACPHLSRAFKLQFYFVPVKRDSPTELGSLRSRSSLKGAVVPTVSRIVTHNFTHSTQTKKAVTELMTVQTGENRVMKSQTQMTTTHLVVTVPYAQTGSSSHRQWEQY